MLARTGGNDGDERCQRIAEIFELVLTGDPDPVDQATVVARCVRERVDGKAAAVLRFPAGDPAAEGSELLACDPAASRAGWEEALATRRVADLLGSDVPIHRSPATAEGMAVPGCGAGLLMVPLRAGRLRYGCLLVAGVAAWPVVGDCPVFVRALGRALVLGLRGGGVLREREEQLAAIRTDLLETGERLGLREDQARTMQRMVTLGRLAGGIAHDFNNLLQSILGYTQLIRQQVAADELAVTNCDEVLKAGRRAGEMVERILAFSRDRPREVHWVDPGRQVAEVMGLLRASLPATIAIESEVAPGCPDIVADSTEIHQVLMNLATNAAQAMGPAGGTLGLRVAYGPPSRFAGLLDDPPAGECLART